MKSIETKTYHILNGDSLKMQFPTSVEGHIIVMRECMIEGPTGGDDLERIVRTRMKFMQLNYGVSEKEYLQKSEFHTITKLLKTDKIILWFEHDLFCQSNLWFVMFLVKKYTGITEVELVTPLSHSPYSFGHLSEEELMRAFTNRQIVSYNDLSLFNELWIHFQNNALGQLKSTGKKLSDGFYFVEKAVDAHIQRQPDEKGLGRPEHTLIKIAKELGTSAFHKIFQHFVKQEAIYGFGDAQVKRMYDKLVAQGLIVI